MEKKSMTQTEPKAYNRISFRNECHDKYLENRFIKKKNEDEHKPNRCHLVFGRCAAHSSVLINQYLNGHTC